MNIKKYISLAGLVFPLGMLAQTNTVLCDFETEDSYTSVGVYDTWADSPFRTGTLKGNAQVVKNHLTDVDALLGYAPNESSKILGVQRSRFGSNTFGALVGLKNPFALKKTTQYVHAKIWAPEDATVMLIGLGNRDDRPYQSPLTEQCWATSSSKVKGGAWSDAVFAISGANGITLRNLLVVVDRTSPHNLKADYAVYIDDIILSSQAEPFFSTTVYPINYDESTSHSRGTDRYTKAVSLSSSDGAQSVDVNQSDENKLYIKRLSNCFLAKPGETVTPGITAGAMSWMAGYVYIDTDNNGKFDVTYTDSTGITDMGNLMSYSLYKNKDSKGNAVSGQPSLTPPTFTIPSDVKPGIYRMRYKVDWDNVDPGGNPGPSNKITDNGGVIVDTRINIHDTNVNLSRAVDGLGGGLNGDVLMGDGTAVTGKTVPFGKAFKVKVAPAPGFHFSHLVIRHGYNLEGDSLSNENLQWTENTVYSRVFRNNEYTIPASYVDGDIRLVPYFSNDSGQETQGGEYDLNFDSELKMTDPTTNVLTSAKFTTSNSETTTLKLTNASETTVYRNLLPKEVKVKAGDLITPSIVYKGNSQINSYFYLDMNQDGVFSTELNSDGTPGVNSELLAYSFYNNLNSKGESKSVEAAGYALPAFRIPADLPSGLYRGRLKLDVNNIDPAGNWKDGATDGIDANGGYVVDFLVNVHDTNVNLEVNGVGGNVVGRNYTGIPETIPFGTAYIVLPSAPATGYVVDKAVIRHGYDLDGDQYIHGNRQWSEYVNTKAKAGSSMTIAKDSINGDVRVYVYFKANGTEEYKLKFSDEFNGEDGSLPNSELWTRCSRENPTWKRFTAQTEEGQAKTAYIENGKLVTRAIANTLDGEGDVDMISGAIESSGKVNFTYGRVEGRLKTTPHTGNFPAFWMMPQDNSKGWPNAGEIDIWEQIDSEDKAYHTIHTNVSYNLKKGATNSGNVSCTAGEYHVIALQWEPELLTWYVDGKKAFSYAKSTDETLLSEGQWPFDKPFYLILNQSVGNGSWAAQCDPAFQYETLFDYVRVYQKEGQEMTVPTGISTAEGAARLDFYTRPGKVLLVAPEAQTVRIVDLQGRTVFAESVQGNRTVSLPKGIYVLNGSKVLVP